MEFPDVGEYCSFTDCKQLDFLFVTCANCKLVFCKDHFSTSKHDCKCLNEFFKKAAIDNEGNSVKYVCSMIDCGETSIVQLLCKVCNKHYCISHRHHGCLDELANSEKRKLKLQEWKKPKEQFQLAKDNADKKVETILRKAGTNQEKLNLANKVRLMKLKGKALGENKIPAADRIYFSVQPPITDGGNCKSHPVFTSVHWSVGRTIDLFAKRMQVENKNNDLREPKLRLFKLSCGSILSHKMSTTMQELLNAGIVTNGECLILEYVPNEQIDSEERFLPHMENLPKYQSASSMKYYAL